VEFILDENRDSFFPGDEYRLQVSMPVTEMVNGLDLVESSCVSGLVKPCRLPRKMSRSPAGLWRCGSAPRIRTGILSLGWQITLCSPKGKHVRVIPGWLPGVPLAVYYDPDAGQGHNRGRNRDRPAGEWFQALNGYHIEGVFTNIDFATRF